MKKGSDVDIVPIVTENKYQGPVFGTNVPEVSPCMIIPLSLWEFKHNKLFTKSNYKPDLRAKPDRLLKKLDECKLIYGKRLDPKKYPIRTNKKALKDEIKVIKEGYIPFYEKGKLPFDPLLKEVFWLTELEQNILGNKVKHSFESIANSVKDKKHIIHEAIKFRKGIYGKKDEKKFVQELKEYLFR